MRVPIFDGKREFEREADELLAAAAGVLRSGQYVLGSEVELLETEVAEYLGVGAALGVGSGTDAIELALRAVGVGPGDLVLTTSFTFFATVSAVLATGAEPVLVDVEPETLTIDPAAVHAVLEGTSAAHRSLGVEAARIRALLPVHLYGQPADMDLLLKASASAGIPVVEDVAQAFGAQWSDRAAGSIGSVGSFSFFPTKNLGGFGDGGLVATDDDELAERVRLLRAHGSRTKYTHEIVGTNSRLDALQAALLRVRLRTIDATLDARRAHAARYDAGLHGIEGVRPVPPAPGRTHTYHQYVVWVDDRRDELRRRLAGRGVETAVHYPGAVHHQPALAQLGYRDDAFPVSTQAAQHVLSLPMFPSLTEEEIDYVLEVIAASA